jgi:hypothetical protein
MSAVYIEDVTDEMLPVQGDDPEVGIKIPCLESRIRLPGKAACWLPIFWELGHHPPSGTLHKFNTESNPCTER